MDAPKERIALKIVALAIDAWRAGKLSEVEAFVTIRDAQRFVDESDRGAAERLLAKWEAAF